MLRCFKNPIFAFTTKKLAVACLTALTLLVHPAARAINVSNANTVTEAQMQTALTGTGVSISNLTITNPGSCANFRRGSGIFTNGTSAVGAGPVLSEPTGVVVASGDFANGNRLDSSNSAANATNALCTGNTSDTDMITLEAGTVRGEYAAIEFDVVPQSTTLAIPFQFASEEFPEYVCSIYTDIVGIFVSGPGINGGFSGALNAENYAKTAAGDLSSINWINTGVVGRFGTFGQCDSLANAAFYTDNSNGDQDGGNATVATTNANLESDGFTNKLYQPITVVAGASYHVKIAVADTEDRTYDSAAFIHPLFSTGTFSGFDYGDAPDSYGTLTSNAGPSHGVDTSIFIGGIPDNEVTGIPSAGADGDDLDNIDDEDGIAAFPALLSNATAYSVSVNVTNNSGSNARLVGWIDFNRNGIFESGEGTQTNVATGATGATVSLNWSGLSGLVSGDTYARIRFSSDIGLSIFSTGSAMSDGEVEDYSLSIQTVNFDKYVSTNATCTDTLDTLTVTTGVNVYYCYTVSNPNAQSFVISPGNTSDDQGHDISALQRTYLPAASQTVIIGPIVSGSAQLPTGNTTVNNASVIATISGTDITDNETASLTVSINPPASGVKQLYFDQLDTGTPDLTRVPPGNTQTGNIDTLSIDQGIPFQSAFTITGGSTVNVQLRMRRRNANTNRTIQAQLVNGVTGTVIGTNSVALNANGWRTVTIPINIAADVNFAVGDFVRVIVDNVPANNGNIQIAAIRNNVRSEVQMQTGTVINVDALEIYTAAYPATTTFASYEPGSTVFIRATVSDPFGSADITSADLTITDSVPAVQVNNTAMTLVPTPVGATRVFEYQYTIPATPDGFWNLSVTANEGSEGTISHTAQATMIIGTPNITISKNSTVLSDPVNESAPKAIPGAIVEYNIDISNAGFGYTDTDSFVLTDPVAAGATFFFGSPLEPITFIDGVTSSGLTFSFISLGDNTDDVDFSNDGGTSFITPTTDANGFDTTSPPINFIRINPKGGFSGSDGTNDPSMQINFRVRVN